MAVERSPSGLRDALFELLDGIRSGTVTTKQARMQCEIASRIIDTGRLELQAIQAARQGLELAAMLAGSPARIGPGGDYDVEVDAEEYDV
jgi:hypothetical protein